MITLRAISQATSAATYNASNPATIDQVFTAVISQLLTWRRGLVPRPLLHAEGGRGDHVAARDRARRRRRRGGNRRRAAASPPPPASASLAWGGRVLAAVPRGAPSARVDPSRLSEPWRSYAPAGRGGQAALRPRRRVGAAGPAPRAAASSCPAGSTTASTSRGGSPAAATRSAARSAQIDTDVGAARAGRAAASGSATAEPTPARGGDDRGAGGAAGVGAAARRPGRPQPRPAASARRPLRRARRPHRRGQRRLRRHRRARRRRRRPRQRAGERCASRWRRPTGGLPRRGRPRTLTREPAALEPRRRVGDRAVADHRPGPRRRVRLRDRPDGAGRRLHDRQRDPEHRLRAAHRRRAVGDARAAVHLVPRARRRGVDERRRHRDPRRRSPR